MSIHSIDLIHDTVTLPYHLDLFKCIRDRPDSCVLQKVIHNIQTEHEIISVQTVGFSPPSQ